MVTKLSCSTAFMSRSLTRKSIYTAVPVCSYSFSMRTLAACCIPLNSSAIIKQLNCHYQAEVWKMLPPTILRASTIAIRETSPCTATSSATSASQTYTSMLNCHPEIPRKVFRTITQTKSRYGRWCKLQILDLLNSYQRNFPTFHCTALCHQAHTLHLQHLWGHRIPAANRRWTLVFDCPISIFVLLQNSAKFRSQMCLEINSLSLYEYQFSLASGCICPKEYNKSILRIAPVLPTHSFICSSPP